MYEFAIAAGPKQRRFTATQAAWLGGVPSELMNAQSLMRGTNAIAGSLVAELVGPVPAPEAATRTDSMTSASRRVIRLGMDPSPEVRGNIGPLAGHFLERRRLTRR